VIDEAAAAANVLVVDDDEMIVETVTAVLTRIGYRVTAASDGNEALERLAEALPDVILSDVNMPVVDGFDLLARVRADPRTRAVPFLFLTTESSVDKVVAGRRLGADDYVVKPFRFAELAARVRTKVERPSVPADLLPVDRRTGLLTRQRLQDETEREIERARRSGRGGGIASVRFVELAAVRTRLGDRGVDEALRGVAEVLAASTTGLELVGRSDGDAVLVLLPEVATEDADARLRELGAAVVRADVHAAGARVALTPVIGWATLADADTAEIASTRAEVASDAAAAHLDLVPVRWEPRFDELPVRREPGRFTRAFERVRLPFQIIVTFAAMTGIPYVLYWRLDEAGHDITRLMYIAVVIALLVTGMSIWIEGFFALDRPEPPAEPGAPWPAASAIIAAYLPNEAATVMETVDAFLQVDYPASLQVILAYNTPVDMPIEATFEAVAARDPRFVPLRVAGSTSKAQNVNAALSIVEGEFVGVFDADHLPAKDVFRRAWRWLSNGWDVVQGHPVVRNGDASAIARSVAVEFEAIYAVSHPGRAKLHGFGIFGGSNGYWRTELLREIRMRGSMLTEDIDSALRVVERGGRIASDPAIVTRELAPADLQALWNQRMRWAQGWWQVSKQHLWFGLRSRVLTPRQKGGYLFLLGWREIYPWISTQMFPIIAYWIVRDGPGSLDWFVPVFVLTTLFTTSVGPGQVFFARRLGNPEITSRRRWILWYLFASTLYYTELKNLIGRVAQLKELMGERAWKVTPRAAPTDPNAS
jgi:cellulose synthase/poly-beta-1,6-N-acetylglucosamine synthase-like glycosyltransferase/CheY-like chemotaxis protein